MAQQGSPISLESKINIVSAKEYFDRCLAGKNAEESTPSVQRVSDALDVGTATVRRVMAEYNRDPQFIHTTDELKRGRPPRSLPDSLQACVRQYVRKMNQKGAHVTIETISHFFHDAHPEIKCHARTIGRALDRWGFTFGKGKRTQHLKEKDHVISARRRYLRKKRANRNGITTYRPEVYLDESYVNKNHSNDFVWYFDEDGPWIQKPTGKGERLIILNAITKNGWVPKAKLVFKSKRKTGDYHGQMNHDLFVKWLKEHLFPNIPNRSLIIMDNATYHNVLSEDSAPTATSAKAKIKEWLIKKGHSVSDDFLKAELVEMLNQISPSLTYKIDEIAAENGHEILRTPPYHPELQPIETCWGVVKNDLARKCDFTMSNLFSQLDGSFAKVTSNTCSGLIKRVQKIEDDFWDEDLKNDQIVST